MQKNCRLISVIVPIYNTEKYVARCIESILKQTYQEIEVILVDDGSADKSGMICDAYAVKDSRIQVIHQENMGLVRARKEGLKRASGKYIGFVDSDDYIDANMFQNLWINMEETNADFVHSGYWIGEKKNACLQSRIIELNNQRDNQKFLYDYFLNCMSENLMTPSIWSKLYKAELIKNSYSVIPDTQSVGEDLLNLTECILRSKKISLLDLANYYYTERKYSLSHMMGIDDLLWQNGFYYAIQNILNNHKCELYIKEEADKLVKILIWNSLQRNIIDTFAMSKYVFKNIERIFNKKIVIYGAGEVGRSYYSQFSRYVNCNIVAWIDKDFQNVHYDGMEITGIDNLNRIDYDIVIVAVSQKRRVDEVIDILKKEGVDPLKIIWEKPLNVCRI